MYRGSNSPPKEAIFIFEEVEAASVALLPVLKWAADSSAASSAFPVHTSASVQSHGTAQQPSGFAVFSQVPDTKVKHTIVKHTLRFCVSSWKCSCTRSGAWCSASQLACWVGTSVAAAAAADSDVPSLWCSRASIGSACLQWLVLPGKCGTGTKIWPKHDYWKLQKWPCTDLCALQQPS